MTTIDTTNTAKEIFAHLNNLRQSSGMKPLKSCKYSKAVMIEKIEVLAAKLTTIKKPTPTENCREELITSIKNAEGTYWFAPMETWTTEKLIELADTLNEEAVAELTDLDEIVEPDPTPVETFTVKDIANHLKITPVKTRRILRKYREDESDLLPESEKPGGWVFRIEYWDHILTLF